MVGRYWCAKNHSEISTVKPVLLRFTDSDYLFGIFKLFLNVQSYLIY